MRGDSLAGRLTGEEGGVGVQARRRALPRARRDRRDRARAGGRRAHRPRYGAALLREAVVSHLDELARRHRPRASPQPPCEVPLHGRHRLMSSTDLHTFHRLFPDSVPRAQGILATLSRIPVEEPVTGGCRRT